MATLTAPVRLPVRRFGETARRDTWWIYPLLVFLGLSTFLVYATWAALQGSHYEYGPYLSPFYSPLLFGEGPHSWFGPVARPGWLSSHFCMLKILLASYRPLSPNCAWTAGGK